MATVTKRELNQQTSRVLATVHTDGVVIVTERGVPTWRIEPVSGPVDHIERLRETGRIIPAKRDPASWARDGIQRTPEEIDTLVADARGDRDL